nr:hypothetical protein [Tissierella sp.]
MLIFLRDLTIFLFCMSLFGFVLVIIKEKIYMKKNIIIIENKYLTKDDLEEVDINEFVIKGKRVKSGDEVKVITSRKETINGTLIGGNSANRAIHMITFDNKIKRLKVDAISKFKIISKYGKFLNY